MNPNDPSGPNPYNQPFAPRPPDNGVGGNPNPQADSPFPEAPQQPYDYPPSTPAPPQPFEQPQPPMPAQPAPEPTYQIPQAPQPFEPVAPSYAPMSPTPNYNQAPPQPINPSPNPYMPQQPPQPQPMAPNQYQNQTPGPFAKPKKSRRGAFFLATVAVVLIAVAVYAFMLNNKSTITYSEVETSPGSANTTVTFVADCGSKGCFDQKFLSCSADSATATVPNDGTEHLRIYGPVTGGCKVSIELTNETLAPTLNNKSMTCIVNNKEGLNTALNNATSGAANTDETCSGPLETAFKAATT